MGRPKGKTTPVAAVASRANARKPRGTRAVADLPATIGDDPEVERRMREIAVGEPSTWQEARIREQTRAEIYRTIAASVELQRIRSSLVPREQVQEAADRMRDALQVHVERIPRAIIDLIDVPPAIKATVLAAAETSVRDAFAAAIAAARTK